MPKHVQEQLLAEVAAVEKDDQGESLFLEAHVDAWLAVQYDTLLGYQFLRERAENAKKG